MMTNRKLGTVLAVGALAMALLLGASAVQAATVVFDPSDSGKAIGITDLDIGGTPYNVAFISQTTALGVYGDPPGVYDFTTNPSAGAAVDAVNAALNAENANEVGSEGLPGTPIYDVGYEFLPVGQLDAVAVWEGAISDQTGGVWLRASDPDQLSYQFDERTYADFQVVPLPGAAWLLGSGLVGLGTVARRRKTAA